MVCGYPQIGRVSRDSFHPPAAYPVSHVTQNKDLAFQEEKINLPRPSSGPLARSGSILLQQTCQKLEQSTLGLDHLAIWPVAGPYLPTSDTVQGEAPNSKACILKAQVQRLKNPRPSPCHFLPLQHQGWHCFLIEKKMQVVATEWGWWWGRRYFLQGWGEREWFRDPPVQFLKSLLLFF